jgi:serine/threonine protein kinase
MGVVYKARDTHLDRFVAIKLLPPNRTADPERKRRFIQEAKAARALSLALSTTATSSWFTMLRRRTERTSLPWSTAFFTVAQIPLNIDVSAFLTHHFRR